MELLGRNDGVHLRQCNRLSLETSENVGCVMETSGLSNKLDKRWVIGERKNRPVRVTLD